MVASLLPLLVCGQDDPEGVRLLKQARQLRDEGKSQDALPIYTRAVAALQKERGADNAIVGMVLDEQGLVYFGLGQFGKAEPLVRRSLEIREGQLGKDHPDVATSLDHLARVNRATGKLAEAEPLFKRALEIREAKLGKDHILVAATLNNLGLLYQEQARLLEAGPLFRRALEIAEMKLGKDHPVVATCLNNLGVLAVKQGKFTDAEPLYRRALEIRETKLGKNHPEVAITLNNLGALYLESDQPEKALPVYSRALEIQTATLENDDPTLAATLNNLANLHQRQGEFAEAEKLYRRCLAIHESRSGKDSQDVALTLFNLGSVLQDQGKAAQAGPLLRRSLAIRQARLGKDHPDVAATLYALALIEAEEGRLPAAIEQADEARRAWHSYWTHLLPGQTEREQVVFLDHQDTLALPLSLSLALAHPGEPGLIERSGGWLLNVKGLAQYTRAQAILVARDRRDPNLNAALQQLSDLRKQLTRLTLEGAAPGDEAAHKIRLADLEKAEREQTARLQRLGAAVEPPAWIDLKQVREALPASAVFLDFKRFALRDTAGKVRGPVRYAVWITPKVGPAKVVDLGPADRIETAVAEVHKAIEQGPKVLKAQGEIQAEKVAREALAKLAKVLLDPLRPHLDKAQRWVISPDRDLWLTPWAALPLDENRYVVEKHTIQLVVSGRDLLPRPAAPGATSAPAIFADPDFDTPTAAVGVELRGLSGDLKLGRIPRLPATASEAEAVAERMGKVFGATPTVLTEGKATSAAFLALKRPKALTLATHGFFLEDQAGKLAEDPLLRCGLLLAGCNKPGESGRAGVLTGREVLSADLRGCELVILSACQTALLDTRQGEGVAGLRQAFQLAGAESVLASLWQVTDDETTLQMTAFMDALAKGKDRVEALALAQRQRILQRREKFGAAHPFNWAAFTLTGAATAQR
jgi:CHAT domain-containing protein/Tfp pilus assembly protein PilF